MPDNVMLNLFHQFSRRKTLRLFFLLFLLFAVGFGAYRASERYGLRNLRTDASHQLDLLAAAIDSEVTRHAHIPGAVGLSPEVVGLLNAPPGERRSARLAANRYLEKLNAHIDGLSVFVLDLEGRVVASSDWIYTDNVLGADFSHRPFFRAAKIGTPYRQYAHDVVRNEPGYFFAHPIRDERQDWKVIGVAVVKSGIAGLERRWLVQDAPALIADGSGVVLVSSPVQWKYMTLKPLSGEAMADIRREQFDGQVFGTSSLDIDVDAASDGTLVSFSGASALPKGMASGSHEFLVLSRHLPETAWRLLVFSNLRPVVAQAVTHAALATVAASCLLLGTLYFRQRRRVLRTRLEAQALLEQANHALERNVAERTVDLSEAVARLESEVGERRRAEQTLRSAQDELVQAAKLAVLGQLATGITHELTQPLGALRTLSGNAAEFLRRGKIDTAQSNLEIVGKLVDQMGGIIEPLKNFARKSPARSEPVDVGQVVASALFLLDQRLRRERVEVRNGCNVGAVIAWCDQNRLQQVLVNLVSNAVDAMHDVRRRVIDIDAALSPEGRVVIRVADSGPGFSGEQRQRLFEPFFTTKPAGEGLGLGLAISQDIVREFGGELSAESPATFPDGSEAPGVASGAVFVIDLPGRREEGK
jgi:two-component system C4-dicarboxylate transport sensor histidine kinase DctB